MRRVLIFLLALVMAVATFGLLQMKMGDRSNEPAPLVQEQETVFTLVFNRELPRGTRINDDVLVWQERLRASVPGDSFVTENDDAPLPDGLTNMLLRRDVMPGDVVRQTILVEGSASFMALTLAPGIV